MDDQQQQERQQDEEEKVYNTVILGGKRISIAGDANNNNNKRAKKPPKPRPNYFLSLRIKNPEIQKRIAEMQREIVQHYSTGGHVFDPMRHHPDLSKYVVDPNLLHLTLFVISLATPELVCKAREGLLAFSNEIQKKYFCGDLESGGSESESDLIPLQPRIQLSGVGNFGERVIYAKIKHPDPVTDRLHQLALDMYTHFKAFDGGVFAELMEEFRFTPHATIMKTSHAFKNGKNSNNNSNSSSSSSNRGGGGGGRGGRGGSRRGGRGNGCTRRDSIPAECYSQFVDLDFGEHLLEGVELSSMDYKDHEGYYMCVERVYFAPISTPQYLPLPQPQPYGPASSTTYEKQEEAGGGSSSSSSSVSTTRTEANPKKISITAFIPRAVASSSTTKAAHQSKWRIKFTNQ